MPAKTDNRLGDVTVRVETTYVCFHKCPAAIWPILILATRAKRPAVSLKTTGANDQPAHVSCGAVLTYDFLSGAPAGPWKNVWV